MDRNEAQQKLAEKLVATKREAKYGHPKDNYRRIAHIWSAVLGIEVTPTQAVLCELGVKFSRLIQSPDDEDTQVDVHGYIKVLQRLLDPEDQPASSSGVAEVKVGEFYSDPAGTTIYADGSKDMTLEEAVGQRPKPTMGQKRYMWDCGCRQAMRRYPEVDFTQEPDYQVMLETEACLAKKRK